MLSLKLNSLFKRTLLLLPFLILNGCFKTPYSLKIHKINEDDPQQEAVITLSDPQIYQRETLINDRLREAELIENLLKESEQIGLDGGKDFRDEFTNQITRDIEIFEAFSLGLDANFDSTNKRSAKQAAELADLDHQIAITAKRQELEDLISNRNGDNLNKDGEDDNDDTGGDNDGDNNDDGDDANNSNNGGSDGDNNPVINQSSENKYQKIFKKNNSLLTELRNNKIAPREEKIKATPQDRFRDLQAYRAELRQELAALNLDDLHDHDSNAIYRMQFRATVMPGKNKDKYGITRLTVHPPKIKDKDMNMIYYAWLNHITYRMNTWNKKSNSIDWQIQYSALQSAGLFGTVAIKLSNSPDNCIQNILVNSLIRTKSKDFDNKCLLIAFPPQYLKSIDVNNNEINISNLTEVFTNKTQNKNENNYYFHQYLISVIKQLASKANLSSKLNTELRMASIRIGSNGNYFVQQKAPKEFDEIVRIKNITGDYIAIGEARVYAANPMEYSQRLSTTAKSANSMEMALAISAGLSTKGVDSKLGIGYLKNSVANVAAIERVPLVVGFSERLIGNGNEAKTKNLHELSAAGWVFGPKVRLNAKKKELELIHNVSAYDVSADFSIPGWWPYVKIKKETAWIGNWFNTGESIRNKSLKSNNKSSMYNFDVSLPLNRTDLDGLTNFIAKKTIGSFAELLVVNEVKPEVVSACLKEVTFLIKGVNVWRSTEVFMSGLRAQKITILPDMEGIAAKFDLDEFYQTKNDFNQLIGGSHKVQLTLWTRNGSDSVDVSIQGTRKIVGNTSTCSASSFVSDIFDSNLTQIVDVIPRQISLCKDIDLEYLIKLNYKLFKQRGEANFNNRFHLNGIKSNLSIPLNSDNRIFNVTFDKEVLKTVKANSSIALSVVDDYDFTSVGINVVSCQTKKSLPVVSLVNIDNPIIGKISNGAISIDTKIKRINGKFAKRNLKFGLRTDDMEANDKKWITSIAKPQATVNDVNVYSAKFKIDANDTNYGSFTAGREIKFALLIYAEGSNTKVEKVIDIPRFVVFYKKGEELITLKPNNFKKIPTNVIKLGLPINGKLAFSGITSSKLTAEFVDEKLKQFKLKVTPDNALSSGAKIIIDLVDSTKQTSYLAEKKKLNKDVNIIITVVNTTNNNIPKVKKLIIKK